MISVKEYQALNQELLGLKIAHLKEDGCIVQKIAAVEADIATAQFDPYELLGLPYDAPVDSIPAAYSAKLASYQADLGVHNRTLAKYKGSKRDADLVKVIEAQQGVKFANAMLNHLGSAYQTLLAPAA